MTDTNSTYKYYDEFESIGAFLDYLDKAKHYPDAARVSKDESGRQWATLSYDEVIKKGRDGGFYDELAKGLAQINVENMAGKNASLKRGMYNDVTGFMPNVPEYLTGSPLNMINIKQVPNPRKYLKIGFHLHQVSFVSTEQVKNRGRALLAVLDALSLLGYAIELWGLDMARNGWGDKPVFFNAIRIKDSTAHWSPAQAAFTLADPSFARRALLRYMETHPEKEVRDMTHNGYGHGQGLKPPASAEFDVFFPYFDGSHCDSETAAQEWVLSEIKKQSGLVI